MNRRDFEDEPVMLSMHPGMFLAACLVGGLFWISLFYGLTHLCLWAYSAREALLP